MAGTAAADWPLPGASRQHLAIQTDQLGPGHRSLHVKEGGRTQGQRRRWDRDDQRSE